MDRFRLKEETLTDGSIVYSVEFNDDYEMDRVISLDCIDVSAAADLLKALEIGVSNISIFETANEAD